jgi:glycosyltransferase involved in cell wall biosynthesis
MIVPIKVGSGTRVKVAEGFARRCPIVATTIGAFGYDVNNGEEILLADRADDFASACILLQRNPQLGEALSERAHKRFLERWTWDSFERTIGTVVRECLARSKGAQQDQAVAARAADDSFEVTRS